MLVPSLEYWKIQKFPGYCTTGVLSFCMWLFELLLPSGKHVRPKSKVGNEGGVALVLLIGSQTYTQFSSNTLLRSIRCNVRYGF